MSITAATAGAGSRELSDLIDVDQLIEGFLDAPVTQTKGDLDVLKALRIA